MKFSECRDQGPDRGVEERDPRLTFLMVEPKSQNLRTVAGFTDILKQVGF